MMQNDRDRLVKLIASKPELLQNLNISLVKMFRLADHILADGWIRLPCKVGETLYLIQVDYEGTYGLSECLVPSKITMFSILRAYEEKTIVYMSTDKSKAEQKLKEMRDSNG